MREGLPGASRLAVATALTLGALGGAACRDPGAGAGPSRGDIGWTDDLGRRVRLAAPARRIVSLSPALTEILFAVGCGDALVLRDAWSDHPAEAKRVPAIGGFVPSAEAIVAMHPDLLLASFPPTGLQGALREAGVPWAAFSPVTLEQVSRSFEQVGAACDQGPRGAALRRRFDAGVATLRAAVQGLARPRVFYEMDAGDGGRPFTVGPGSFAHALIVAAGGRNVFEDSDRAWFQVSAEAVVAARPEVIVLADAGAIEHAQSAASVARRPGWSALEAVKRGRVHALKTDWVARPGPRLIRGLWQLARLLHPRQVPEMPAGGLP